jgi:hypothetical protein
MRTILFAALIALFTAQAVHAFTWDLWTATCEKPTEKTPVPTCGVITMDHAPAGALRQSQSCSNWGNSYETKFYAAADCSGPALETVFTNATDNSNGGNCDANATIAITCTRNYGKEASPAAAIVLGIISGLVVIGELAWFIMHKIHVARNPERNPFDE